MVFPCLFLYLCLCVEKVFVYFLRGNLASLCPFSQSPLCCPRNIHPATPISKTPKLINSSHPALRLSYGPIARLPRVAPSQTLTYTNPHTNTTYPLPPGTVISTSIYTIHQNATLFPNPQAFLPSRWLPDPVTGEPPRAPLLPSCSRSSDEKFEDNSGEKLTNYLLTFGKGSRSCLGMSLAWAELYITLANVVRKCEMELWETGRENVVPDKEYFLSRPKKEGGVRVRVM